MGAAALGAMVAHDLTQKQHAILRNFPVVGHLRFQLERFGPELRQYIVTSNDEERPFSRDQRRWVYASSKLQNNYFGFGTDNDMETLAGYVVIKHRTFRGPARPRPRTPTSRARSRRPRCSAAPRGRRHAFRPGSVVNVSGMSFGALSGNAIEALNRGADLAGCLQNTGEGGVSSYHRSGGDLVFQIGTSYFGCRDEDGRFDLGQAQGAGRVRADPGAGDQALAGRQAGPGRHAAGRQGERGDRRDPRHQARAWTVPRRAGTPRSRTSTRCSTSSRCWPTRPGCRSASSRPSATSSSGTTWSSRWPAGSAAWTSSTSTAARAAPAPRR